MSEARTVLVIDDDPAGRDWMRRIFSRAGYRVVLAEGAAVGAARAADRPDLVVCDVHLPDGSGLDLASRLRGDPRTADIPILHVSAVRVAPRDRAAGLRAGADAYLVSPADPDETLAVAGALLRARAAEKASRVALDRLVHLHEATATLAHAGTPEAITAYLTPAITAFYGAEGVEVAVVSEDGAVLELVGTGPPGSPRRLLTLDRTTPLGRAVRDRTPVTVVGRTERLAEFPAQVGADTGAGATVDLPLCTADGAALGGLSVRFARPGPLPAELLEDLETLSGAVGQALERAHLEAAERASHSRLQALQDLTGALSRAPDRPAVAAAAVQHALSPLHADAATLVAPDGEQRWHLLAALADALARGGSPPAGLWVGTSEQLAVVSPVLADQLADAGHRAWCVVPVQAGGLDLGALCFSRQASTTFSADEQEFARTVAQHVGDALLRARAVDREREAFLRLQRRLLPLRLPQPPGWSLVPRYRPAQEGIAVGGDWYDAVPGPDGALTLLIGDVAGHGTEAVALMSRLRHSLHACLALGAAPDAAVSLVNRLVAPDEDEPFATLLAVTVHPGGTGVTVVSAGHPPVLLVSGDGIVEPVDAPPNRPLGVTRGWQYRSATRACPEGSTFLLYTGGLIERPGEDLDAGLARLVRALPSHPEVQPGGLEAIADDVVRRCASPSDDSALLLAQHRDVHTPTAGRGAGPR